MTMNLAGKIESSPPPGQKMGRDGPKVSNRLLFVWRFLLFGHLWDCLHGRHGALEINLFCPKKKVLSFNMELWVAGVFNHHPNQETNDVTCLCCLFPWRFQVRM